MKRNLDKFKEYHCWNFRSNLDSVKIEVDGTIVGTCWRCGKDAVSAIENDEAELTESSDALFVGLDKAKEKK